ncbi:MAG: TonB family protein [Alphaproteobacteria bacterium]|nr:TonB family protein [Alphaproteobacteria bacterium]
MAQEKAAKIIDLNVSREAPGPGQAQSAGDFLAASRRAVGTSLATVSAATNVKIEHLEAIEATNTAALPTTAFAIGFVKVYAQFLGLDAESVAKQFKKDIGADASAVVAPIHDVVAPSSPHIGEGARMVSIFGIIAILIFVFWIVIQITGNPGDSGQVQIEADQPVRLGATPVAAPELRPRSTAPATVTVSPPVEIERPAVEKTAELAEPTSNSNLVTEAPSPQPAPEAPGTEAVGFEAVELETVTALETSEVDLAGVDTPFAEPVSGVPSFDASSLLLPLPATDIPSVALPSLPVQEEAELLEVPDLAPVPLIVNAILTRSVAPRYPDQCTRNAAALETVTVIFDVTIKGRAANARIAQTSNACFNDAAMVTIRRWRFDPKTVDGVARIDIGKQAALNFRR